MFLYNGYLLIDTFYTLKLSIFAGWLAGYEIWNKNGLDAY